ncbi:Tll0287-like domain-containing protein [Robiginitalea marina]|uniref:DUF3365 domain-containing protein n=1 Tax=Robiginitalea marina TaxID=2954105 RepID=A0ABT1B1Q1_9FLAO|nr:DUF3365 domain-containing protein [Robiginitalea marina]MCO5725817.1 DUF3365 domain-containing protein [Robiginitalea marina]
MKKLVLAALIATLAFSCKDKATREGASDAAAGEEAAYTEAEYLEAGREYALQVQGALGKTLQQKMMEEGTLGAIGFCKVEALPITDSLSRSFGVAITRITDKPRNPYNQASEQELELISAFRAALAEGQAPEPRIVTVDGTPHYYAPIVTNAMCIKCHGAPQTDLSDEVVKTLDQLYPNDLATGYSANELRGLWKVAFTGRKP